MKKLVAFAAIVAAVSFASCGNKSAESTEVVAKTETVETTIEAPVEEATEVAPADSTAAVEAAPAE